MTPFRILSRNFSCTQNICFRIDKPQRYFTGATHLDPCAQWDRVRTSLPRRAATSNIIRSRTLLCRPFSLLVLRLSSEISFVFRTLEVTDRFPTFNESEILLVRNRSIIPSQRCAQLWAKSAPFVANANKRLTLVKYFQPRASLNGSQSEVFAMATHWLRHAGPGIHR